MSKSVKKIGFLKFFKISKKFLHRSFRKNPLGKSHDLVPNAPHARLQTPNRRVLALAVTGARHGQCVLHLEVLVLVPCNTDVQSSHHAMAVAAVEVAVIATVVAQLETMNGTIRKSVDNTSGVRRQGGNSSESRRESKGGSHAMNMNTHRTRVMRIGVTIESRGKAAEVRNTFLKARALALAAPAPAPEP